MKLKRKPIVVFIDEIFIEIGEKIDISKRDQGASSTNRSFGPKKGGSGKYGFFDQIADSVSVEVNKIYLALRTLGRLKTTSTGIWTPPVLLVELSGNRLYLTNHNNVEASIDECLRVRVSKRSTLFVYKSFVSKKVSIHLVNPSLWIPFLDELLLMSGRKQIYSTLNKLLSDFKGQRGYVSHCLVKNMPFRINISFRKRLDNNMLLGCELTFIIGIIRLNMRQDVFKEVVHVIIGIVYGILRKDVIEEVYGPNPHRIDTRRGSFSPDGQPSRNSLAIQLEQQIDSSLQFNTIEQLDRGDSWQQTSTTIGDEDPPHFRFAAAFEISDVTISLIFPDVVKVSKSCLKNTSDLLVCHAINIHVMGFVYTTIWPERAGITEGVMQMVFRSLLVTETLGANASKNILCRTTGKTLDMCDHTTAASFQSAGLPFIILPRGVREFQDSDPEINPGLCFMYRRDMNWPPPPINKGKDIAIRTDILLAPVEVTINLNAYYALAQYLFNSYDSRYFSGQWSGINGRLEGIHSAGSMETVISLNGISIFLDPKDICSETRFTSYLGADRLIVPFCYNDVNCSRLLPISVTIELESLSFSWNHSTNIDPIQATISSLMHAQAASNNLSADGSLPDLEDSQFSPCQEKDLTFAMYGNSEKDCLASYSSEALPDGIELLSDRFEATIQSVSIAMITKNDFKTERQSSNKRNILHPMKIVALTSIDPHPLKKKNFQLPSKFEFENPYTRPYYWTLNSGTVNTLFMSINSLKLALTLSDVIQISNLVLLINEWIQSIGLPVVRNSVDVHPVNKGTNQCDSITIGDCQYNKNDSDSDESCDAFIEDILNASPTLIVLKISEFDVEISKNNVCTKNGIQSEVLVGLQFCALQTVLEWAEGANRLTRNGLTVFGQLGRAEVKLNDQRTISIEQLDGYQYTEDKRGVNIVPIVNFRFESSNNLSDRDVGDSKDGPNASSNKKRQKNDMIVMIRNVNDSGDGIHIQLASLHLLKFVRRLNSSMDGVSSNESTENLFRSFSLFLLQEAEGHLDYFDIENFRHLTNITLSSIVDYFVPNNEFSLTTIMLGHAGPIQIFVEIKKLHFEIFDESNSEIIEGVNFKVAPWIINGEVSFGSLLNYINVSQNLSIEVSYIVRSNNQVKIDPLINNFNLGTTSFLCIRKLLSQSSGDIASFTQALSVSDIASPSQSLALATLQNAQQIFLRHTNLISESKRAFNFVTAALDNAPVHFPAITTNSHYINGSDIGKTTIGRFGSQTMDDFKSDIISSPNLQGQTILADDLRIVHQRMRQLLQRQVDLRKQLSNLTASYHVDNSDKMYTEIPIIYCGWVRRSAGFSEADRSVSKLRIWASLRESVLEFYSKPNSSTPDLTIVLGTSPDASRRSHLYQRMIGVVDPDEQPLSGDATSLQGNTEASSTMNTDYTAAKLKRSKQSLTTKIWLYQDGSNSGKLASQDAYVTDHNGSTCSVDYKVASEVASGFFVNSESASTKIIAPKLDYLRGSSIFVMDCDSLDEKVMWLDALRPWTIVSEDTANRQSFLNATRRTSKLHTLVDSKLGEVVIPSPEAVASNAPYAKIGPESKNIFGSVDDECRKTSSKSIFRSAASGMMKALNIKSTSKRIHSSGANPLIEERVSKASSSSNRVVYADEIDVFDEIICEFRSSSFDEEIQSNDVVTEGNHSHFPPLAAALGPLQFIGAMDILGQEMEDLQSSIASFHHKHAAFILSQDKDTNRMKSLNKTYESLFDNLKSSLQYEIKKNQEIQQKVIHAQKKQEESESLLQACTIQNINAVLNLSKQNDDILDQYMILKQSDMPDLSHVVVSQLESNLQMSSQIVELEITLREQEERVEMAQQEVLNVQLRMNLLVEENRLLKELLVRQDHVSQPNDKESTWNLDVSASNGVNTRLEKSAQHEDYSYKCQYIRLLESLQELKINVPSK